MHHTLKFVISSTFLLLLSLPYSVLSVPTFASNSESSPFGEYDPTDLVKELFQAERRSHPVHPDGIVASPSPPERYFQIHPGYDETKCLDVRQSGYADGTPVDIFDCNGTPAQNWVIQPGTTQVKVAGRNFCLDASADPINGTKMKIWTCYPGLPAQTWYYTDDKRIALKGQGMCLDLTDGNAENFNVAQVWKCTNGNGNQIWSLATTV